MNKYTYFGLAVAITLLSSYVLWTVNTSNYLGVYFANLFIPMFIVSLVLNLVLVAEIESIKKTHIEIGMMEAVKQMTDLEEEKKQ